MGDTAFTNTIKPISGKTVTVEGDLEVTGSVESGIGTGIPLLPPGLIFPYAGGVAPEGYLLCDGRSLSRTTYANLFAAIGTTWGSDNSTSFKIPDLRGAFLRGSGSHGSETKADGTSFIGKNLGSFENDQIQLHGHEIIGYNTTAVAGNLWDIGGAYPYTKDAGATYPGTTGTLQDNGLGGGTPRTGDETRPFNASVNYIIKI